MTIPFPARSKTLLALMGPSIIFAALSLSGGEMLLWPSITSEHGLGILWPVLIILTLQFGVNMEIERYSLVTGKSTEGHLMGNVRFLSVLFAFAVLVSLVWPAWVTTAGNIIAVLIFGDSTTPLAKNAGLIISIVLLGFAIFVFRSKNTYKAVEQLSRLGLIIALIVIITVVVLNFNGALFVEGLRGLLNFGYLPSNLNRFDFLSAVAYGGVAGVLNLVQSEWVIAKKYGAANVSMAQAESIEFESEESQRNFKSWFRAMHAEHFIVFFCANIVGIFLLAYLGRLLLPIGSAHGFGVLAAEIRILNEQIPYLGVVFGLAGAVLFTMANVTILDAIGRLTSRILEPIAKQKKESPSAQAPASKINPLLQRFSSPSSISIAAAIAGMAILFASLIIPQLKQPYTLLVLSASMSSVVMWLYPPLLIKLNLSLPKIARPSVYRAVLIVFCTVFYGAVSLWALASVIPVWLVAIIGVVVTAYQLYFVFIRRG